MGRFYFVEVKKKAIEVFYTSIASYQPKSGPELKQAVDELSAVLLPALTFPDDHLKSYNHRRFENVRQKSRDC